MSERPAQPSPTTGRLFVVESYDDTGIPGRMPPLPAPPAGIRVLCAVCVPADDVVLALVEGGDETTVSAALTTAGWRVDRMTPATWAHVDDDGAATPTPQMW